MTSRNFQEIADRINWLVSQLGSPFSARIGVTLGMIALMVTGQCAAKDGDLAEMFFYGERAARDGNYTEGAALFDYIVKEHSKNAYATYGPSFGGVDLVGKTRTWIGKA